MSKLGRKKKETKTGHSKRKKTNNWL